jgi:hypothetical protein
MKRILLALPAFFLIALVSVGQPPEGKRERVEAMKIGFLTDRLDLSPDEAKLFWPVYNKYQDELDALRKGRRNNLMNARQGIDEMSDADVAKTVDAELQFRQSELDIIRKYDPQFRKILPIKKVASLYQAEEAFKRKLLEMLQDRRDGRNDDRPGPPRRPGR